MSRILKKANSSNEGLMSEDRFNGFSKGDFIIVLDLDQTLVFTSLTKQGDEDNCEVVEVSYFWYNWLFVE